MSNKKELHFKIHVPKLLQEITDNAIGANGKMGVLKVPMNTFRIYLGLIGQRCAEINDPVLNKLMVDMALYEQADPASKEYSKDMVERVYVDYDNYMKNQKS